MSDDPTYHRTPGISHESSGDRVVILDAEGLALTTLNPTGSAIWEAVADGSTLSELTTALLDRVDGADPVAVRADIASFLVELERRGLVEAHHPS